MRARPASLLHRPHQQQREGDGHVSFPGVPFHTDPWTHLTEHLTMGGHDHVGPTGSIDDVVVTNEFDLVLSLYRRHGSGPAAGVPHRYMAIPDGYLAQQHIDAVRGLAQDGAAAVTAGRHVLARCQAGYNRSGLLAAFILIRLGYTANDAIALIRERRGPHALCNEHFVELIHAEYATVHGDDWQVAPA